MQLDRNDIIEFDLGDSGGGGRPDWHDQANCQGIDPELFFPARGASTREAKAVCAGCEVRQECLTDHLYERFGIWGGLSERERRAVRRQVAAGHPLVA